MRFRVDPAARSAGPTASPHNISDNSTAYPRLSDSSQPTSCLNASAELPSHATTLQSQTSLSSSSTVPHPSTPPPVQPTRPQDSTCCLAHAEGRTTASSSFQDAASGSRSGSLDATATSPWPQSTPVPAPIPSARPPTTSAAPKSSSQQSLHSLCAGPACSSPTKLASTADVQQQPPTQSCVFTSYANSHASDTAKEHNLPFPFLEAHMGGFPTESSKVTTPSTQKKPSPPEVTEPQQTDFSFSASCREETSDGQTGALSFMRPCCKA